jgi:hypothetical protein
MLIRLFTKNRTNVQSGSVTLVCATNRLHCSICGGDDGARTRDLCRDSELEGRNLLKTGAADGPP